MKDYYGILGVIKTAEDIVIKAAYRALAQKYHPDKFSGTPEEAKQRMQEINEAYSVLSDREKREEYDRTYEYQADENNDSAENDQSPQFEEQDKLWDEILEYFPDLKEICYQLGKVSKRLVQTFKYQLLETKDFKNRANLAKLIENIFLESYFGTNQDLVKFGRLLILCRFKEAALKLNRAVNIFGSNVESKIVIEKICSRDLSHDERLVINLLGQKNNNIPKTLIDKALANKFDRFDAKNFIREFNGDLTWHENFSVAYYITSNTSKCSGDFEYVLKICHKLASVIK